MKYGRDEKGNISDLSAKISNATVYLKMPR